MRHRRSGRKLGITASHRKAMLANMITSLFKSERIETTLPKAKEARQLAERMITFARRGNAAAAGGQEEKRLAARRHIARTVRDSGILRKLFDEIAPRFADRPGGYTRILRLGSVRVGDAGRKAILELLKKDEEKRKKKKTPRKTYHKIEMPAAPVEHKKETREAEAGGEGAAPAESLPGAGAPTPVEGAAPAKKPEAKAAETPKKEKAHKTGTEKARKAVGEKKAKAKPADTKAKGKKE